MVGQEEEIVSDPKLMLVALCAVGHWTLDQIVDTYDISQAECIRYLTRLDRRKIIALQPGNRIRPLISRTFSWLPARLGNLVPRPASIDLPGASQANNVA